MREGHTIRRILPPIIDDVDKYTSLVSTTHTLPVNIFNLEGGEIMLAQDNKNFRTPGENWTHDPPNTTGLSDAPTTEPEGCDFDSCPGHGNFLSRASMVSPPSKLKMFTGSVCVLLTSVSSKLIKIKMKLIYATKSSWEQNKMAGER